MQVVCPLTTDPKQQLLREAEIHPEEWEAGKRVAKVALSRWLGGRTVELQAVLAILDLPRKHRRVQRQLLLEKAQGEKPAADDSLAKARAAGAAKGQEKAAPILGRLRTTARVVSRGNLAKLLGRRVEARVPGRVAKAASQTPMVTRLAPIRPLHGQIDEN